MKMIADALLKELPPEVRSRLPENVRRFVIDVNYNCAVRIIYETFADDEVALPLVEAILKADVEIVEAQRKDDPGNES